MTFPGDARDLHRFVAASTSFMTRVGWAAAMDPQPTFVVRLVQDDFDGAYDDVPARAIAAA